MVNTICSKNLDEAKEIFLDSFKSGPRGSEVVKIENALNRVLVKQVTAPEDYPPFSRSLLDGYAVTARDTSEASEEMPVSLKVAGQVKMGEEPSEKIDNGLAMYIPTGGMLPQGADAVAKIEKCRENGGGSVRILSSIVEKENVSFKGDDFKAGEKIIPELTLLRPPHIALMAELNIMEVEVGPKPIVAIFSTGDEIVEPIAKLRPGQIRDCNSYTMAAMVEEAGGIPLRKGIIKDDFNCLRESILSALNENSGKADMVLVTGGTAAGRKDFTAEIFDSIGSPGLLVNGVAMKGGKPVILAGAGGKPLLGLPGYPQGAIYWFDIFVRSAIRRLLGCQLPVVTGQ